MYTAVANAQCDHTIQTVGSRRSFGLAFPSVLEAYPWGNSLGKPLSVLYENLIPRL